MSIYQPGDVVIVTFTYTEEGKLVGKKRPGVILKEGKTLMFAIIQVTTKNRSDTNRGLWIEKNSERGKLMNLRADSFINLEVIKEFNPEEILMKIGKIDSEGMDLLHYYLTRQP